MIATPNATAQQANAAIEWTGDLPYGISDLASDVPKGYADGALVKDDRIRCCVAHCQRWVRRRRAGQSNDDGLYCPEHGISLSTAPTYIYKNHLRNFIVGRELLAKVKKVESWRLGNETSEDALSFNVFVGLLKCGGLRECFRLLTRSDAA